MNEIRNLLYSNSALMEPVLFTLCEMKLISVSDSALVNSFCGLFYLNQQFSVNYNIQKFSIKDS